MVRTYRIGDWWGPPLIPFRMMVVDVSPDNLFVTFSGTDGRSGLVVERTFVTEPGDGRIKPFARRRSPR